MTTYLLLCVAIVIAAALTIWGLTALEDWAERRDDPVEPPSRLDRMDWDSWDWGGDR